MNATKEHGTYKPKIKADQKQGIFSREFLGVKNNKQFTILDRFMNYPYVFVICLLMLPLRSWQMGRLKFQLNVF